ncbi:ATP-NAD kinase [Mesotoga sp. Brook.08.YT.4.2.5.1]|nr:ATP-NAD kinase [Mesotoga sp. Brook.08.YT.4.2.5.1]PNS41170.1 ATP-NAD kinase [Mesotoga sp. B105.6.4]PVD17785.1 ATP-NAD kinase [Mesotoga sp. Brook.08.105.5.1]PXF34893.1 ATP-NAD kinase [Mesotoga sp. SC_NapDC]RAM60435.1 ATP-NAD kinase [Mesotoga sp. SC_4PWA21]RAM60653.1 ATP-NAD kinase [Mesotoga sp. SC_3PWM13N19]RDI93501.1 ATP-NAD kinase [Mesotoga sp. Brook.08.YT.4.2.5.2.]
MRVVKAAVFYNRTRISSETLNWLSREIESHGIATSFCEDGTSCLPARTEVILTFGGDGTVLKAVPLAVMNDLPIMSFRVGSVGFLAAFELSMLHTALDLLLLGKLESVTRHVMEIEIGDSIRYALNDCVVERSSPSRTVSFSVNVCGQSSYPVVGDGIVFATNTGSTAYSMAAGGALVDPDAGCFQVTPICPHNPFVGSVVLAASRRVLMEVRQDKGYPIEVYVDGTFVSNIRTGDKINVGLSEKIVSLLREGSFDFVALLKKKLAFGGRLKDDI